jgi:hypothetical protein
MGKTNNYINFRHDDAKDLIIKLTKMKNSISKNIGDKLKTSITHRDFILINKTLNKIAHNYCHDDIWYNMDRQTAAAAPTDNTKMLSAKNKTHIIQSMKKTIKEYIIAICRYIANVRNHDKGEISEKQRNDLFNDMFNESEIFFSKMKSLLSELSKHTATRKRGNLGKVTRKRTVKHTDK